MLYPKYTSELKRDFNKKTDSDDVSICTFKQKIRREEFKFKASNKINIKTSCKIFQNFIKHF